MQTLAACRRTIPLLMLFLPSLLTLFVRTVFQIIPLNSRGIKAVLFTPVDQLDKEA